MMTRQRREDQCTYLGRVLVCLEENLAIGVWIFIELLGRVWVAVHASKNLVRSKYGGTRLRLVHLLGAGHDAA